MLYERLARPVVFRLGGGDPEVAHERTVAGLARLGRRPALVAGLRRRTAAGAGTTVFGVRFPGLVGLAAGMDKDGRALPAWPALGFAFVEVGTVTRHPQPGNPRPRLFRLPASDAVINRMGFNNHGADALAERLAALGPQPIPLGISIGKSKVTPVAEAVEDYRWSLRRLAPFGDYFAVNVSSPNTPGLRGLQDRAALDELLGELRRETDALAAGGPRLPLLVKIAPDLDDAAIGEVLEVCDAHAIDGLIATNTTIGRDGLAAADRPLAQEQGGLSGSPVHRRAVAVVSLVARETGGRLPVIGVGGIGSPDDARRMLDAGASLVQVYTGLVYRGPGLVRRINRALADRG
ncbi:quinone-dependent dihydroorotate dehydrogenase [Patulibacter defluvii]|uniref:quinone-dependent dihydroorotate dehydrogenase n=1 Tax=Patulibacter defluvii TaxID=3095358 RepID=UPI002A7602FD|nr:quinone-dependent dihydroorotate dehydrogenase [Patulibacter sp. DM4]